MTTARWIREFVGNHPDYKHDSVVSDSIAYDLLTKSAAFSRESTDEPDLLFSYSTKSADSTPQATSNA